MYPKLQQRAYGVSHPPSWFSWLEYIMHFVKMYEKIRNMPSWKSRKPPHTHIFSHIASGFLYN